MRKLFTLFLFVCFTFTYLVYYPFNFIQDNFFKLVSPSTIENVEPVDKVKLNPNLCSFDISGTLKQLRKENNTNVTIYGPEILLYDFETEKISLNLWKNLVENLSFSVNSNINFSTGEEESVLSKNVILKTERINEKIIRMQVQSLKKDNSVGTLQTLTSLYIKCDNKKLVLKMGIILENESLKYLNVSIKISLKLNGIFYKKKLNYEETKLKLSELVKTKEIVFDSYNNDMKEREKNILSNWDQYLLKIFRQNKYLINFFTIPNIDLQGNLISSSFYLKIPFSNIILNYDFVFKIKYQLTGTENINKRLIIMAGRNFKQDFNNDNKNQDYDKNIFYNQGVNVKLLSKFKNEKFYLDNKEIVGEDRIDLYLWPKLNDTQYEIKIIGEQNNKQNIIYNKKIVISGYSKSTNFYSTDGRMAKEEITFGNIDYPVVSSIIETKSNLTLEINWSKINFLYLYKLDDNLNPIKNYKVNDKKFTIQKDGIYNYRVYESSGRILNYYFFIGTKNIYYQNYFISDHFKILNKFLTTIRNPIILDSETISYEQLLSEIDNYYFWNNNAKPLVNLKKLNLEKILQLPNAINNNDSINSIKLLIIDVLNNYDLIYKRDYFIYINKIELSDFNNIKNDLSNGVKKIKIIANPYSSKVTGEYLINFSDNIFDLSQIDFSILTTSTHLKREYIKIINDTLIRNGVLATKDIDYRIFFDDNKILIKAINGSKKLTNEQVIYFPLAKRVGHFFNTVIPKNIAIIVTIVFIIIYLLFFVLLFRPIKKILKNKKSMS
ncbi:hypothetical protein SSYRP_v1c08820 [Spiroplasma syrphidicola EA-1]|uniref:Transmembrane protein n=1 Tax=Spiroplasma syrphidicola EA-1 TaxID=1276229 RepID=R4UMK5_9MOLU|nr:hypothetical protein [Spiroplasma syrphidicola]AGM26471.1 hypothetical protein SSYRP_v1c08820 [Spiroplasma syrphidicola EA-1]